VGDEMIGAYGVSGATSDQDEVIARHARAKVGRAHRPATDTTPDEVKAHINELYGKAGIRDREL